METVRKRFTQLHTREELVERLETARARLAHVRRFTSSDLAELAVELEQSALSQIDWYSRKLFYLDNEQCERLSNGLFDDEHEVKYQLSR